MRRVGVVFACFGLCMSGGGGTGCGGGTLGGNGGGNGTLTGASGAVGSGAAGAVGSGAAGSVGQGFGGRAGAGAGGLAGDGAPPPGGRGASAGRAGIGGIAGGRAGSGGSGGVIGIGGSGGVIGIGGSGGASCPVAQPPVCGISCGNGRRDICRAPIAGCPPISEDCDGMDFGAYSCAYVGYSSGGLVCNPDCTLDFSRCGECAVPDGLVASCGPATLPSSNVRAFGIAATDSEVGVAHADYDFATASTKLIFARLSPSLTLEDTVTLDDTSQPGPLASSDIYQPAVAAIPGGWVVAACAVPDAYIHAIGADGRDLGRTVVSQRTDPTPDCLFGTLSLAARPGGGPLLLWKSPSGLKAAVVADDGLSAGAPQTIATGNMNYSQPAGAAWVGDAFYVATTVSPSAATDPPVLRLLRVGSDGAPSVVADLLAGDVGDSPRLAVGAGDLRLVYPGEPSWGTGYPDLGVIWQPLGLAGELVSPATVLGHYTEEYFSAPAAIAFGNETVVLMGSATQETVGIVRVALDGRIVTPVHQIARAPAPPATNLDMVQRGPDLVVGWLSPNTFALMLARLTP